MRTAIKNIAYCAFMAGPVSLFSGGAAAQCLQPAPAQVGNLSGGVIARPDKVLEAEVVMLIRLNACSESINKGLSETVRKAGESREKLQIAVAALIATSKDLP